jgi:hypothetical protein
MEGIFAQPVRFCLFFPFWFWFEQIIACKFECFRYEAIDSPSCKQWRLICSCCVTESQEKAEDFIIVRRNATEAVDVRTAADEAGSALASEIHCRLWHANSKGPSSSLGDQGSVADPGNRPCSGVHGSVGKEDGLGWCAEGRPVQKTGDGQHEVCS